MAKKTVAPAKSKSPPFRAIRERAAKRKGGEAALRRLLPPLATAEELAKLADDRVLSRMAQGLFSAGFAWSVIEAKWPEFEKAFLRFRPGKLLVQSDEFWDGLIRNPRIVRNAQKIMAVRDNARFVSDVAAEHGSFGKMLAAWPGSDYVGLLELLARRGSRLGGFTGQYLLRNLGKDGFIVSTDMVACLRATGLDIAEHPSSKRDLARIQERFNAWAEETGLPLAHISRICAMSTGENYDAATLRSYMGLDD